MSLFKAVSLYSPFSTENGYLIMLGVKSQVPETRHITETRQIIETHHIPGIRHQDHTAAEGKQWVMNGY